MPNHNIKNLFDTYQGDEYNEHNKTLVCSENKNNKSLLEEKDSKPIIKGNTYLYLIILVDLKSQILKYYYIKILCSK